MSLVKYLRCEGTELKVYKMDASLVGGIFMGLVFLGYICCQVWEQNIKEAEAKDAEIRAKLKYLGITVSWHKNLTDKDYQYIVRGM